MLADIESMDVFVARQAIFDRSLKIHGYELLFRSRQVDSFDSSDADMATLQVIANVFLSIGADKTRAREKDDAFVRARAKQRLHQLLGVDDHIHLRARHDRFELRIGLDELDVVRVVTLRPGNGRRLERDQPTFRRAPHQPHVDGLPPVVVVSTTGDPATPYQAGVDLAAALHGRLLTYEGTQHTAFLQGNPCVDGAGVRYLVDLSLPGDGSRCSR